MHALIGIVGPTGSGKSELSLHAASRLGGEIVNCDSLQVYRGFNAGTAKLSVPERNGIPHHLIDIVDPGEVFTAGEYARLGRLTLADIARRGRVPVVVGGTGFYLRALIAGLPPGPVRDEVLRDRLLVRENRRKGSVHRILQRLDPSAAKVIHPNDVKKALRALEIRMLSATRREELPAADPLPGFQIVKVGLNPDRALLHERLNSRLEHMFRHGLIEEVRALLAGGVSPLAKPFESLGYKHALLHVQGKLSFDESLKAAQLATRQYSKRQMTWFRGEPDVHWFNGFGDAASDSGIVDFIIEQLKISDLFS